MTPTPEDHEAAAEIARNCKHPTYDMAVPCLSCIAAALAEAVRDERERILDAPLPICPGCYDIVEAAIRSEAQATPAPAPAPLRYCDACKLCERHCRCRVPALAPVGPCMRRGDGTLCDESCFICCQVDPLSGTPPETKERG